MDSIWIIVITVLGIAAIVGSIAELVGQRGPRVAPDPERLALLRDRLADDEARRRLEQVGERIAEERDARSSAPQRRGGAGSGALRVSTERVWAGGL